MQLGAKFLDVFEDRYELVRLSPPMLRQVVFSHERQAPGAVVLEPPSIEVLATLVRQGRLILLKG